MPLRYALHMDSSWLYWSRPKGTFPSWSLVRRSSRSLAFCCAVSLDGSPAGSGTASRLSQALGSSPVSASESSKSPPSSSMCSGSPCSEAGLSTKSSVSRVRSSKTSSEGCLSLSLSLPGQGRKADAPPCARARTRSPRVLRLSGLSLSLSLSTRQEGKHGPVQPPARERAPAVQGYAWLPL